MGNSEHSTAKPLVVTAGRCIYCRDDTYSGLLTREHVLPRAIGGGIIIREAVCEDHQKLINTEIETPVLTHWLGPFRHALGLVSKETASDSERRVPIIMARGDAPATQTSIRVQDHPPITIMPVPSRRPGWFDFNNGTPVQWAETPALVMLETAKGWRPKNGADELPLRIEISHNIPLASFLRFLAKVAHGVAFSQFGFKFTPWLLELIEGKKVDAAGAVIGAPVMDVPEPIFDLWHRVNIAPMPSKEGEKIVGVTLNLFAGIGGPPYFVLAGYVSGGAFGDWGRTRKIAPVTVSTKA